MANLHSKNVTTKSSNLINHEGPAIYLIMKTIQILILRENMERDSALIIIVIMKTYKAHKSTEVLMALKYKQ